MHTTIVNLFALAVLAILLLVPASTFAGIATDYQHDHLNHNQDYYAHPKYAYNYGVKDKHTGDYKHAYEVRDGPYTYGSYSVLGPDGVMRTTKYRVSKDTGYQAVVINSGHASHPEYFGWEKDVKAK